MEAHIAGLIVFPVHYNVEEGISDKRFSPVFLNDLRLRSLFTGLIR